jgi:hypothetical protein
MKTLLSLSVSAALVATTWAIPQTFNTGILGAGGSVEKFAGDPASWTPSADLPGSWSAPAADGTRKLTDKAVVFGVPAAEVQAVKSNDRLISLRVVFRDSGKDRRTLLTRVSQGISAFTGHPGKEEGHDTKVFRYEKTQIRATPAREGEVVVEFTPAP